MLVALSTVLTLGLTITFGFPCAARAAARSLFLETVAEKPAGIALANAASHSGYDVDSFPIMNHDSPAATEFPLQVPDADDNLSAWQEYFTKAAEPTSISGLSDIISDLFSHLSDTSYSFSSEETDFEGMRDEYVEGKLKALIPDVNQLSTKQHSALNDFASAILLVSMSDMSNDFIQRSSYLAPIAFSLWTMLLKTDQACLANQNLYFISKKAEINLPQFYGSAKQYRQAAETSCADTRTIDYFDTFNRYLDSIGGLNRGDSEVSPTDIPETLLTSWNDFLRKYPGSSSGLTALADAQLALAGFENGFSATNLYRDAIGNANMAYQKSGIPEAALVVMNAQAKLGEAEALKNSLVDFTKEVPERRDYSSSVAELYLYAGEPLTAKEWYEKADEQPFSMQARTSVHICLRTLSFPDQNFFNTPQVGAGFWGNVSTPHYTNAGGCGAAGVEFASLFQQYVEDEWSIPAGYDLNKGIFKALLLAGEDLDTAVSSYISASPKTEKGQLQAKNQMKLFHSSGSVSGTLTVSNLLRKYQQFDAADKYLKYAIDNPDDVSDPRYPELDQARAEVAFLTKNYDDAVKLLDLALANTGYMIHNEVKGCELYGQKVLAAAAGNAKTEDLVKFHQETKQWHRGTPSGCWFAVAHSAFAVANSYMEAGDYENAEKYFQEASENLQTDMQVSKNEPTDVYKKFAHANTVKAFNGAIVNNWAIIAQKSGKNVDEAIEMAQAAFSADTASPIYTETLAWILQENGKTAEALKVYEQAFSKDSTMFSSLNNAAVLHFHNGDTTRAVQLLRQAVTVRPDYAIGWANLSDILGTSWSPLKMLQSQGAWARAVDSDIKMRGKTIGLQIDREVYQTGLDVSKVVSPEWKFTSQVTSNSKKTGWSTIVLSLIAALGAAVRDNRLSAFITNSAKRGIGRKISLLFTRLFMVNSLSKVGTTLHKFRLQVSPGLFGSGLWNKTIFAIALATALVVHYSGGGGTQKALLLLVVILLTMFIACIPMLVRKIAALAGETPALGSTGETPSPESLSAAPPIETKRTKFGHFSYWPLMAVSALAAPFGTVMAPLPALKDDENRHRAIRMMGLASLYILMIVLFVMSLATNVPITRTLAVAVLLMASTMILPFKPIDGAFIKSRLLIEILSTGGLALGVALAMNWL